MAAQPPQQAVVRSPKDEPNLTISLPLAGRVRNLDRPKLEALEKALSRLCKNAMPKKDKQGTKAAKQQPVPPQPDLVVKLHAGPTPDSASVQGDVPNEQAWQHGRLLVVGSEQYIIDYNPPAADKVLLPCIPMVGIPVCPVPETVFAEPRLSQWQWFRSQQPSTASQNSQQIPCETTAGFSAIPGASERLYTPSTADSGHNLLVQIIPCSRSEDGSLRQGKACCVQAGPVQQGPALAAGANRHPLTSSPLAPPAFRVITYNILADQYASRQHSQKVLFSYCPTRFLDADYRRPLILQELLGFQADILCLQEVDEKAFAEYFQPQLQQAGFEGHYLNKSSGTREGEATFYRRSRFRLARKLDLSLRDCFQDILTGFEQSSAGSSDAAATQRAQRAKRHAQFKPLLQSSPQLAQVLLHVATVAQISLLEPTPAEQPGPDQHAQVEPAQQQQTDDVSAELAARTDAHLAAEPSQHQQSHQQAGTRQAAGCMSAPGSLCVVNSHFFFHPHASHVRNMHAAAIMSEVEAFIQEHLQHTANPHINTEAGTLATGPSTVTSEQAETASAQQAAQRSGAGEGSHNGRLPEQPGGGHAPAVLMCGDLNCALNHGTPGVVQLFNSGHLPHDFWDWDTSAGFSWGGADSEEEGGAETERDQHQEESESVSTAKEKGVHLVPQPVAAEHIGGHATQEPEASVRGIPLSMGFDLQSADNLQTPFTNYVRGYSGLLDYIWYEPEKLQVRRGIPLPSLQEVQGFLPSQRFPSDHLPVVYEFSWKGRPPQQQQQHAQHPEPSVDQPNPSSTSADEQVIYPIAAMPHNIPRAVSALQQGQVIALPTDTLYGLAADANSTPGIQHIYSIKQRQARMPLAICVAEVADLQRHCVTDHLSQQLLEQLLPGKVTLILQRKADAALSTELNPGLASIGVRIPESEFIRGVCRQLGGAVALTSANLSGGLSPLCVSDFTELWPQCAAVFNGLRIQADRAGSTIVDLTVPGQYAIVRPGVQHAEVQHLMQQAGLWGVQ